MENDHMPRKAKNVPANETPEARFVRIANDRVNRLLTGIKQLGGLGDTKTYKSSAEQRKQIDTALTTALTRTMESMNKGGEVQQEFKLK
jgi:hypothetical protein